ncbi:hypothetical protein [Kitasatospora sp. NPDC091207]|uniref:Y-family DNA polymerase n=1 Tax=Kitasatospora sp. NPDC091207 TaxID=3364083 RepID=UPI00380A58B7
MTGSGVPGAPGTAGVPGAAVETGEPGTPRVLVVWCPDWPVVAVEGRADGGRADGGSDTPVAVVAGGRILACSEPARAAGVRQGQRLKLAQRLCPALELRERDPEAETRRFEPVVAAVEAFTPRVEVLRPGLCAIPMKGPSRYFGGEEALTAKVQRAVAAALAGAADRDGEEARDGKGSEQQTHPADPEPAGRPHPPGARADAHTHSVTATDVHAAWRHPAEADRAAARRRAGAADGLFAAAPAARDGAPGGFARPPEPHPPEPHPPEPHPARASAGAGHPEGARSVPRALVGVADGLFAAVLAARAGVLVPAGRTAEFLAPYPVAALGDGGLAELLDRLGLPTVGAFAALPAEAVADRFGPPGTAAHRLARGLQPRPLVPRTEGPDLSVEQCFDPPEPLAEPLVFVARTLAEQVHRQLAGAGLTCQRVAVEVVCADGRTVSRLWRHEGRLSATALAERVRWQLQAWQGAGTFAVPDGGPAHDAGFTALRLVPDDLSPDQGRQLALWGQAVADDRVERAVARVQAVLGHAGLRRIEPAGGRGPGEQAVRVPWGEPYDPVAPADAPWPGRLRDVWPAVVHRAPVPVAVLDMAGRPVVVDGRAGVSARPARIAVRGRDLVVEGWTGPWPAVEYWWDQSRARRRARFQVTVADGRALLLTVENGEWFVEAGYD